MAIRCRIFRSDWISTAFAQNFRWKWPDVRNVFHIQLMLDIFPVHRSAANTDYFLMHLVLKPNVSSIRAMNAHICVACVRNMSSFVIRNSIKLLLFSFATGGVSRDILASIALNGSQYRRMLSESLAPGNTNIRLNQNRGVFISYFALIYVRLGGFNRMETERKLMHRRVKWCVTSMRSLASWTEARNTLYFWQHFFVAELWEVEWFIRNLYANRPRPEEAHYVQWKILDLRPRVSRICSQLNSTLLNTLMRSMLT